MQATGNASGSSDLPRLRDCAAEQAEQESMEELQEVPLILQDLVDQV